MGRREREGKRGWEAGRTTHSLEMPPMATASLGGRRQRSSLHTGTMSTANVCLYFDVPFWTSEETSWRAVIILRNRGKEARMTKR